MRHHTYLLLMAALLTSTLAISQITADPEERQGDGRQELKTQTPEGKPLPFGQRLRFGGGVSALRFQNPFQVGLSPVVAYNATERLIVGVGINYIYSRSATGYFTTFGSQIIAVPPYTQNSFGGRAFAMYEIIPSVVSNLYAHVEYESNTSQTTFDGGQPKESFSYSAPLIGATYMQPISRRLGINVTALYNVNYGGSYAAQVFYGSPWVFRISFF
jgi:hypothetical protein